MGKTGSRITQELRDQLGALVLEARAGERSAFERLIHLTGKRFLRFCLYLTGDQHAAEELWQTGYMKAVQGLHSLKDPGAFLHWLYRITQNHYLEGARAAESKIIRGEISETPEGELVLDRIADPKTPDLDVLLTVQSVFSRLSIVDRSLLILVDQEGYSYLEAAEALEISEDAARSRVHRARKAFLAVLEDEK